MMSARVKSNLLPAVVALMMAFSAADGVAAADLAQLRLEGPVDASAGAPPPGVLYDQTDSPAGAGFTSQVFEAASSTFDCRGADDFNVPAADIQWDIAGLQVAGAYLGSGPTPLLDVEIFTDGGGVPSSTTVCSFIGLQAGVDFTDDGTGNLDVSFPGPCVAPAGDYWLSVRADMDSGVGQWLWVERTVQTGTAFAWENPGDGFGTGCVSWSPAGGCGASDPDLIFALIGVAVPVDLQSFRVD